MESIEIEDKTPEAAIKKALKILKVSRKDAKIQILSEEKKGLFGMKGGKPARVRVTIVKK
ncbi:MAG: Jag N-terminal domain-containing protein [Candidatus Omnitrophica bacterium]|nr:Jag N-terminal domain-containing protein [Candidatus Omnitrophota bacterium]